jgi:hypothetical protein
MRLIQLSSEGRKQCEHKNCTSAAVKLHNGTQGKLCKAHLVEHLAEHLRELAGDLDAL